MSDQKLKQDLLTFCELLLTKKGLQNLPEEVKSNVLMDLYTRVDNWIMTSLMQALKPEQLRAFQELTEKQEDPENPAPEVLQDFFISQISNYGELVENSLKDFAKTYLESK